MFDRTAKRLAAGPTVVVGDAEGAAALLARYTPNAERRGERLLIGNGVLLHGPIDVTADMAAKAGVPEGTAYFADIAVQGKANRRPDDAKERDAEGLIRGLAARLHGTKHSARRWSEVDLDVSVYAERPISPEQVISVLEPYAGHPLVVDPHEDVEGAYLLAGYEEPTFITVFWPARLARSKVLPPPPSVPFGDPCRWELLTSENAATPDPDLLATVGNAALALAGVVGGVVTDMFGFPITRPEDLVAA